MENQNHQQKQTKQLLIAILVTSLITALIVGLITKNIYSKQLPTQPTTQSKLNFPNNQPAQNNKTTLKNAEIESKQNQTYQLKADNGGKISINYPAGWQVKNDSNNLNISSPDDKDQFSFSTKALQSGNIFVSSSSSYSNGTNGYSVKTEQNGTDTTITIDNKPAQIRNPFDDKFFQDLDRINQEYDQLFARMKAF